MKWHLEVAQPPNAAGMQLLAWINSYANQSNGQVFLGIWIST